MQVALSTTCRRWARAHENPGGYTWRVLVNVCRDELRLRKRLNETEAPLEHDSPSFVAFEDAIAARHDLLAALSALPYNQRETVVLRYYLDLSVAETAHVLGIAEGTVKSMSARALGRLKQVLSTDADPELTLTDSEASDVDR